MLLFGPYMASQTISGMDHKILPSCTFYCSVNKFNCLHKITEKARYSDQVPEVKKINKLTHTTNLLLKMTHKKCDANIED